MNQAPSLEDIFAVMSAVSFGRSTERVPIPDDLAGKTLVAASDLVAKKNPPADPPKGKKRDRAKQVGSWVAKKCLEKGIKQVVFDRAGYRYHGRVSSIATGAREAGLKF